jgi:uncharacterized membrane protein
VTTRRFWEIDFIRGIAVILMIFFHATWNLVSFGAIDTDILSFSWQLFGKSIGFIFVFILGLSLTLSRAREIKHNNSMWLRLCRRGATLLGLGIIVSIATYLIFDRQYVRFGILHLLGSSIILSYPFLKLSWRWNCLLGCIIIAIGNYLLTLGVGFPWLLPLGLMPWGILMVDYYPLLPWFGAVLFGIAAGNVFYASGDRQFTLKDYSTTFSIDWFIFLGRHSLAIYLIHQPIILAFLSLTGIISFFDLSL